MHLPFPVARGSLSQLQISRISKMFEWLLILAIILAVLPRPGMYYVKVVLHGLVFGILEQQNQNREAIVD